jgi:hypothetical protein
MVWNAPDKVKVMKRQWIVLLLLAGLLAGCSQRVDRALLDGGQPDGQGVTGVGVNTTPRPTHTPCPPCPTCPPPAAPTATARPSNRAAPIAFDQPFEMTTEAGGTFVLAVTEAYRGQAAWERIVAANQFNEPPPEGMDYLLVYATVDYVSGPESEALVLDQWSWRVVTHNEIHRPPSVVEPAPAFDLAFFPGASGGGWMSWLVYEDDRAPLLVIGLAYDGSSGVYFATGP